jgi:hypothetical protein
MRNKIAINGDIRFNCNGLIWNDIKIVIRTYSEKGRKIHNSIEKERKTNYLTEFIMTHHIVCCVRLAKNIHKEKRTRHTTTFNAKEEMYSKRNKLTQNIKQMAFMFVYRRWFCSFPLLGSVSTETFS